ncbi:MAG: hypothetical protein GX642_09480 [Smithella sp.]|nr:hypothetical protein [Smithella sp.]
MKRKTILINILLLSAITAITTLGVCGIASAHFDALDGPIVQDVRKALDTKDATPILKWVKQEDETTVREAFVRALHARNKKNAEEAEKWFYAKIIKVHLAGREVPFTGLKPEGQTDPVIAVIDQALASGSPDALLKHFIEDITHGIRKRYEIVEAAYRQKDESVAQGRAFVEIYIDFIHYMTGLKRTDAG